MKRLRVLIVGVGSIGERHLRCFQQTGRVDLALCEPLSERRLAVAQQYGVEEMYADYEAVAQSEFDAAVIAIPAHLHVHAATHLAEKGCHLLIEKPVSTSMDGVADLARLILNRNLVAAVGYVHRAHPMMRMMKAALKSKRFGEPVQIVGIAGQNFPTYRPVYRDIYYARREQGGGAIQDAITHMLNAGEWLAGPIESLVSDAQHQVLDGVDVEDTVHVLTRQGAAMGSYVLNQYQAPNEMSLTVACTSGTVRFERHNNRWGWMTEPDTPWRWETVAHLARDAGFVDQAHAFLDAVEGNGAPFCTLGEGIQTLRVNLACLQHVDDPIRFTAV